MKEETIVKMFALSMLILGYFIAASHGYNGFLFTTIMVIIAHVLGLEIGLKKGGNNGKENKGIGQSIGSSNQQIN